MKVGTRTRARDIVGPLVILVLLLAGCSSGEATSAAPSVDVPAEPPPTTAPVRFADPEPTAPGGTAESPPGEIDPASPEPSSDSGQNPWEVVVLTVNDDARIVPAFDGPNGNPITIYDVNVIDGIELEYPLYAETYFGNRLSLVVEQFDNSGAWAEVKVPVRPNGTTAWVQTAFFTESRHDYHITIDISDNTVRVFKGEELIVEQLAVSGRESRPTPTVRAYIDEMIPGSSLGPAYGSWVLSIAAFSESLGTFGGGGMPKLALHGTNQPELMGEYVSSGCVRVPDEIIELIAETVPVGTIVDIVD